MARSKKSKGSKSPLIRLIGLEAVAVTASMAGAPAMAAPGDLDPSFGDVGRQSGIEVPSYFSNLWSVDVQGDDSVLFGGGGEYEYWGSYEDYFVGRLLPNGTRDTSFAVTTLQQTAVYDTTLQADGRVIGVGVARQSNGRRKLLVFRLQPGGALDPGFGLGGLVIISDGSSSREAAYSVVVDPDGRIVVAGQRGHSLVVARLLADGTLDGSFGSGGIYQGPETTGSGARIARTATGGYRVIAYVAAGGMGWDCSVVGLTGAGVPDAAFGNAGIVSQLSPNSGTVNCTSLAVQPDGRIMLGGEKDFGNGYAGRLLANGALDPAFDGEKVTGRFESVTALALDATGSIFVAGKDRAGTSGALVVRLLADGTLDTRFGRAGSTSLDLNVRRIGFPSINDMKVVAGGGLVVGGVANTPWPNGAFVARLLGDAAGGSPGIFSMKQERVLGTEQGVQAVLSVRRTGGSQGAVAVTYTTRDFPASVPSGPIHAPGERATSGADYTATTGRLTWSDGDVGEREIMVPIASDTSTEPPEFFEVVLESPEGGAGLGAHGADVEIAGASYPVGDLTIDRYPAVVSEGDTAEFFVYRNHYTQGAISVTVKVAAGGSASPGDDFTNSGNTWQDVVLTWADGESGGKRVTVRIVADGRGEQGEFFALELVAPTGGAMLGAASKATMQISATSAPASPTAPPPASSPNRGGGAFGWLGALLCGMAALRRRSIRNR